MTRLSKSEFFSAMEVQGLALAYDDVRLKTGYSEVLPALVSLKTRFSTNIDLKCPIVSAPMDTVTDAKMAIAMALTGGLGIIHRGLDYISQAHEAARVKSYLNTLIENPVCVFDSQTIEEIEKMRREKGYTFHSFPVINRDGRFVGLLGEYDFDFCTDYRLPAGIVMNQNPISMPAGTSIADAYKTMQNNKQRDLPLVDDNNCVVAMYAFSDVHRIMTNSQENYNLDPAGRLRVGAAIGTDKEAIDRAVLLVESGVDVIVIDTAHGDSKPVYDMLKAIKENLFFQGVDVVVGNISEGESAKRLVKAGADGIKVGQGPGSICTTRIIAGIGCPQVTAIYNCSTAIFGSDIPVCADGGIKYSGDITVALGAGADSIMLGGLLAGTDEAPGQIVNIKGVPHKTYRGMGSIGAMRSSEASRQRYGQQEASKDQLVPEGVEGAVPCRGKVENQIHQFMEGLRRGMGYVGASTIQELQDKAEFYRITSAGLQESHPHDVVITADMPNYQGGTRL